MKRSKVAWLVLGVFVVVPSLACMSDNTENPYFVETSTGVEMVTVDNLLDFGVAQGQATVMVTPNIKLKPDTIELVLDDVSVGSTSDCEERSCSVTWDSTQYADGFHKIWARVTNISGGVVESNKLQVVVLNKGQTMEALKTGNSGILTIEADYRAGDEVDIRHYWNNPAGVSTIGIVLTWLVQPDQTEWEIGLSTGQGFCPHRGKQYGPEFKGTTSPLLLAVTSTDINAAMTEFPETPIPPDPATNQYFLHLRPYAPEQHKGQSLPYQFQIFLFGN